MTFTPTYHERNLKNLAQLGDKTKEKAIQWYQYLIENKIDMLIYETIRTTETQKANVAKGASQTMKSYHIVGQALDFVPVDGKTTLWNGYGSADAKKAIAYAKKLGFEWGGDWSSFVDKPHLQYNYKGYGTDTFKTKGNQINIEVKVVEPVKTEVKAEIITTPSKDTDLGLVDWMKSKKMDSSYSNRTKLAKQYGISGYEGTASQNEKLLGYLKSGKKATTTTKTEPKKAATKKKYVQLPKTSDSWRVYPTNKSPVKGNEKGFLNPKKFGGLEYEVLATPQTDLYTIKTGDFGKVNIYAASSTGAKVVTK